MPTPKGIIINVLRLDHPHVRSIFEEGLWGFPENKINLKRWKAISQGDKALIYAQYRGKRGIWMLGMVRKTFLNRNPVKYWDPPTGYPLQLTFDIEFPPKKGEKLSLEDFDKVRPLTKEELAMSIGIPAFRPIADRWSLFVFEDSSLEGVTYPYSKFDQVLNEFEVRNKPVKRLKAPSHKEIKEIIYEMGLIQRKFPAKEYDLDGAPIDVVWRKTEKSAPYIAWEIQIGGNLYQALTKLKHAFDIWNSIPILVTTQDQVDEAKKWIEGSFHEIAHAFRVVTWERIREFYESKKKVKSIESELGIMWAIN